MKSRIKQLIAGTPLEPVGRRVYAAFATGRHAPHTSETEDKNRQYDMQTIEVMKRVLENTSNCVDVGCHHGSILREVLRFAPAGTHFAFEPIPELFTELRRSFGHLPNLRFYDLALSDTKGETPFQHVVTNPAYSGFCQRRYDRPNETCQEIVVKADLLDRIIPEDTPIKFIKVDVEGAELLVFKGAVETIRKNRPVIIFEHGLGAADCYQTGPDDVYELLVSECGLRLFLMAKWLESSGRYSLSKQAFSENFWKGRNYYFMAHP